MTYDARKVSAAHAIVQDAVVPRSARSRVARALDAAAALFVLYAVFAFFIAPKITDHHAVAAPPLTLTTTDGRRIALAGHHLRPIFLDFWASWCEPCKASIPLIQGYARAHPRDDIVSVDVGEPPAVVHAFLAANPMEEVALDSDQAVARAFGVVSFPTMVVINRDGNEQAKWVGFNPDVARLMFAVDSQP